MATISIHVTGDSGAEAAQHLHQLVEHIVGRFVVGAPKPAPAVETPLPGSVTKEPETPAETVAETPQPKKPGRKKTPETIEGTATEIADLTIEQAREKAREIAAAPGGTAALTDALKSFGVGKMSELPAKGVLYSAFIAKIEELVKVAS